MGVREKNVIIITIIVVVYIITSTWGKKCKKKSDWLQKRILKHLIFKPEKNIRRCQLAVVLKNKEEEAQIYSIVFCE